MAAGDHKPPHELDDGAFERLLLDSARHDGPGAADVQRAWASFDATCGALASRHSAGDGPPMRASWQAGVQGWIVGAICGVAIAASVWRMWPAARFWQQTPAQISARGQGASAPPRAAPVKRRAAADPRELRELSPARPSVAVAVVPGPAQAGAGPRRRSARSPVNSSLPVREDPAAARGSIKQRHARAGSTGAATLAAEVAALDAVHVAFTSARYVAALRLVDQYQRDFPRGQLAPEAEALAIEVLAAQQNRGELETRAARFLRRRPSDPHAARISALLREAGR